MTQIREGGVEIPAGKVEVTKADRELFIFLLGFDVTPNEGGFQRILDGKFDAWEKMQRIARHRIAYTPTPSPEIAEPFADARDFAKGFAGMGMSADVQPRDMHVQVAEQRVAERNASAVRFSDRAAVRDAIVDPGTVCERKAGDGWLEDYAHWQASAAITVFLRNQADRRLATPKPTDPTSAAGEREAAEANATAFFARGCDQGLGARGANTQQPLDGGVKL